MGATDQFKQTIKAYLDKRASEDELFANSYAKENKNIDECINYILSEVQKSGCNGQSEYHQKIINLVKKNMNLIKKAAA